MSRVEPVDDESLVPPPPDMKSNGEPPAERQSQPESSDPRLSEDEARKALLDYVSENCCFGKGTARELQFTEIVSSNAYHYTLETYTERRYNYWRSTAYRGEPIDGPENGTPPKGWEIEMPIPEMFHETSKEVMVPHTQSVKNCDRCHTTGYVSCHRCRGQSRIKCSSCNGSGQRREHKNGQSIQVPCRSCNGQGNVVCNTCSGTGKTKCNSCGGEGRMKVFLVLNVSWNNNVVDHIVEKSTNLPNELVRSVSGQITFEEVQPKVLPIQHFKEPEINAASVNLIQQQQFPKERLLQQRQRVRVIPITRCGYKWKEKSSEYIVYGFENKVYAPDYPQAICWGCSIL